MPCGFSIVEIMWRNWQVVSDAGDNSARFSTERKKHDTTIKVPLMMAAHLHVEIGMLFYFQRRYLFAVIPGLNKGIHDEMCSLQYLLMFYRVTQCHHDKYIF